MLANQRLAVVAAVFLVLFGACSNEREQQSSSLASASDRPSPTATGLGASTDAGSGLAGQPYWPRFHGPGGDNLSAETGLLKTWDVRREH